MQKKILGEIDIQVLIRFFFIIIQKLLTNNTRTHEQNIIHLHTVGGVIYTQQQVGLRGIKEINLKKKPQTLKTKAKVQNTTITYLKFSNNQLNDACKNGCWRRKIL